MEIRCNGRHLVIGAVVLGLVLALAAVGRAVTPVAEGSPVLLTPERWHAGRLARQAAAEIARLTVDGHALRTLAASEPPDAVAAMLLAQRIYAAQRSGTTATAATRTAMIEAAAATARYAGGGMSRATAIAAVNVALNHLQMLQGLPEAARRRDVVFLPLVRAGGPDSLRAHGPADR